MNNRDKFEWPHMTLALKKEFNDMSCQLGESDDLKVPSIFGGK